jgi:shikimate kinase
MQRLQSPDRVALVGMMGSGKSTIGRLLSARTGWPFYDNDTLLQRATGLTARDFLAKHGELELRAAEAAALRLGLASPPPCIVAVAAGTIEEKSLRDLLQEHATCLVGGRREDPHRASDGRRAPPVAGSGIPRVDRRYGQSPRGPL